MKILTSALLLSCIFMMSSCEKNNCYSCRLLITQDGVLWVNSPQPKLCRVKKSYIEKYKEDSARTWTAINRTTGTNSVYEQHIECTTDDYW